LPAAQHFGGLGLADSIRQICRIEILVFLAWPVTTHRHVRQLFSNYGPSVLDKKEKGAAQTGECAQAAPQLAVISLF
jgi:hypothetical protein